MLCRGWQRCLRKTECLKKDGLYDELEKCQRLQSLSWHTADPPASCRRWKWLTGCYPTAEGDKEMDTVLWIMAFSLTHVLSFLFAAFVFRLGGYLRAARELGSPLYLRSKRKSPCVPSLCKHSPPPSKACACRSAWLCFRAAAATAVCKAWAKGLWGR